MSGAEILKELPKLREALRRLRADPTLPHHVQNPMTGELIDLLDGETDRFLDEVEHLARLDGRRK